METAGKSESHVTLDMTGAVCPGPLAAAKKMVEAMDDGAVLLLISDCPGTGDDLRAWARHTRNHVLREEALESGRTGYYIQKGDPWIANVVLDMRGARCPVPIIETGRLIDAMAEGEILKLISNCQGVHSDIESWARTTRHELLGRVEEADGAYQFFIRK